jgi:hypothetical protein
MLGVADGFIAELGTMFQSVSCCAGSVESGVGSRALGVGRQKQV